MVLSPTRSSRWHRTGDKPAAHLPTRNRSADLSNAASPRTAQGGTNCLAQGRRDAAALRAEPGNLGNSSMDGPELLTPHLAARAVAGLWQTRGLWVFQPASCTASPEGRVFGVEL